MYLIEDPYMSIIEERTFLTMESNWDPIDRRSDIFNMIINVKDNFGLADVRRRDLINFQYIRVFFLSPFSMNL